MVLRLGVTYIQKNRILSLELDDWSCKIQYGTSIQQSKDNDLLNANHIFAVMWHGISNGTVPTLVVGK